MSQVTMHHVRVFYWPSVFPPLFCVCLNPFCTFSNACFVPRFVYDVYLKGVDKKISLLNFRFAHISASIHRIFKILVPIPPNPPPIMWGRHKNFKYPMYRSWDMSTTKIQNQGFFCTPFSSTFCMSALVLNLGCAHVSASIHRDFWNYCVYPT